MIGEVKAQAKEPDGKQSVQGRAPGNNRWLPTPEMGGLPIDANLFLITMAVEQIPPWSIYPARRDKYLREYWRKESIAAGAVYSLASKLKALSYQVTGSDAQVSYAEGILRYADFGAGFRQLITKTITDLLTQDNGTFWELVGGGDPRSELIGPVTQVNYLDPAQCIRTYDPDHPVLYVEPVTHSWHLMHKSRIHVMSSMPQGVELGKNIGFCAISRALSAVHLYRSIQTYRDEKASGRNKRGIITGKGVTTDTLMAALNAVENQDDNRGVQRYAGLPVLTSSTPTGVELDILDLASLPDGFMLRDEVDVYVYTLALTLGVDARELWPATSSGATKADASVQNMKSRGKGMADLITTVEDAFNNRILPKGAHFEYDFVDDEHDREVAEQQQIRVATLNVLKAAGAISAREMRALCLVDGILDGDVLENIDDLPGIDKDGEEEWIGPIRRTYSQTAPLSSRGSLPSRGSRSRQPRTIRRT